jgi:hypothetical protein
MPAEIIKDPDRKGKYTDRTPWGVKGRGMTLRNAKRQEHFLNVIDHGF